MDSYSKYKYSYFGARYYDPNISIWLSVDPLSDKYPNLSPYAYTANNPVMLVDPNGMEFTEYENAKTKEVINIKDGIDERVQVSNSEWGSIKQLKKGWDAGYKDSDAGVAEIVGKRKTVIGEGAEVFGDSDGQLIEWRDAEHRRDPIDNSNYRIRTKSNLLRKVWDWLFPINSIEEPLSNDSYNKDSVVPSIIPDSMKEVILNIEEDHSNGWTWSSIDRTTRKDSARKADSINSIRGKRVVDK